MLNFGQVGEILENFQKHTLGESFWKMGSKVIFGKIYKRFPCKKWEKFFIGDFHGKLKVKIESFTRDFPGKKMKWKIFLKGFLLKIEAGEKN